MCEPYQETDTARFERIVLLFKSKNYDKCMPVCIGYSDAMESWGACNQGYYGDQLSKKPSRFQIVKYYKWHAWNKYKGKDRDKMQK